MYVSVRLSDKSISKQIQFKRFVKCQGICRCICMDAAMVCETAIIRDNAFFWIIRWHRLPFPRMKMARSTISLSSAIRIQAFNFVSMPIYCIFKKRHWKWFLFFAQSTRTNQRTHKLCNFRNNKKKIKWWWWFIVEAYQICLFEFFPLSPTCIQERRRREKNEMFLLYADQSKQKKCAVR